MSLINEALKKAQRQRGEPPSAGDGTLPVGGVSRTAPGRLRLTTPVLLVLIGSGLLVVGGMLVVFLWPKGTPVAPIRPAPQVASTPVADTRPVSAAMPAPSPAPTAVAFPLPAPDAVAPPAAAVTAVPPPVATAPPPVSPPPAVPVTPVVVATVPPPVVVVPAVAPATPVIAAVPPPPPVPTTPKPDPRVTAVIEVMRVNTVSSAGSRAVLNNQVFKVGDVVDRTLGLRLTKIALHSLTFADAVGLEYVKEF